MGTETINTDILDIFVQMNGCLINTNTGITFYNTKNSNLGSFGTILLRIILRRGEAMLRFKTRLFGMKRNGFPCIVLLAGDYFTKNIRIWNQNQ